MTSPWIEGPLLALAVIAPLVIIWKRMTATTDPKGIGVRVIQLIALLVIVPVLAVLLLEGRLTGDSTGALLGVVIGYALGGITAPVPGRD